MADQDLHGIMEQFNKSPGPIKDGDPNRLDVQIFRNRFGIGEQAEEPEVDEAHDPAKVIQSISNLKRHAKTIMDALDKAEMAAKRKDWTGAMKALASGGPFTSELASRYRALKDMVFDLGKGK